MRRLGEQWIEELDGKMHMYKAVKGENCTGCAFGKMCQGSRLNNIHVCDREDDCPLEYSNTVVKDLGILNKDGCLPAPWDSTKYPKITVLIGNVYNIEVMDGFWFMQVRGDTLEKAIERWNRRVL